MRYLCFSLLVFILVLSVSFLITIYTTWGSRQIINIAGHYSGGELKIESVSGSIADNLALNRLSFKSEAADVALNQLVFNWEWSRIFSGEISISRFELNKLAIQLEDKIESQQNEDDNKSINMAEIMNIDLGLLLSLKLRQFSISDSFLKYGEQTYSIDAVQLGSSLEDSVVQIDIENANAQIKQQSLYLKTSLKLDTSGDIPSLNGNFVWSTNIEADQFSGNGVIRGDFSKLTLNHNLTKPWQIDSDFVLGIDKDLKPYYSVITKWRQVGYPIINPDILSRESAIKVEGNNQGLDFEVSSNIDFQQTLLAINSKGKFDWNTLELIKLDVTAPDKFSTSILGTVDLGQEIKWRLVSQSSVLNLDQIVPQAQKEQLSPKIMIRGLFNQKTGLVKSMIKLTEEDLFAKQFSTVANIEYADNRLVSDVSIESPYKLKAKIKYDTEDDFYEVNALWTQLFWPVKDWQTLSYNDEGIIDNNHVFMGEIVLSDKGKLHIKGSADQYTVTTYIKAAVEGVDANLMLNGGGAADRFKIVDSTIKSSVGILQTTGNVSWGEQTKWSANLGATKLNLETFGLTHSDIGLGVKVTGKHFDKAKNIIANITEIRGSLGDEQIRGYGQIVLNQDASKTDVKTKIDLNLGKTLAKLNIAASQAEDDVSVDGDYQISINNMKQLVPGAKGKAMLQGKIFADKQGYHAVGNGSLAELNLTDFRCEKANVEYQVSAQNPDNFLNSMQANIAGNFIDFRFGDTRFKHAKVAVTGGMKDHRFKLEVSGDYDTNMVLNGSLDQAHNWKAMLSKFNVENDLFGRWTSASTPIELQEDNLYISEFCLNGSRKFNDGYQPTPEKICVDGAFSESLTKATIHINKLDMLRFKNSVPPDIGVNGLLSGDIDAEIKDMDFINARISSRIESEKGILQLTLVDKKKVDLPYELAFDTTLHKRQGEFKAGVKVNGDLDGSANAQFELPYNSADLGKTKLVSNIYLQLKNFEWVDEIWPEFESVKANLTVNATANGEMDDLSYRGSANISEGQLAILAAGIELKEIKTSVDFNTEKIVFNGYAKSGYGKISISGDADKKKIYPLNIDIIGNNFRVVDTYEAKVDISPLLALQMSERKSRINGTINIDQARIRVGDLPDSAVSVSDDVQVIKPDQQEQKQSHETEADLKLNLGDNFSFKGFGLTTKLAGGLNIKQNKGLREGFGDLELIEGKFKKMGIKLDIEKGQLIFVGPLENPALNIKAARKLERAKKDEKVSVLIEGTLKNPRLVFPEESTYGQTNTMSNLLTGKSVGYSVGLSAGGRFKDKIQDQLGLDSFEITAAGWMLGKYLTPDLYMSYTTKWLENETQFKLRYNLNRLFTLEAKGGDQQGADIFYTLERE
ncbi:MAG: hypothetical protein D6B28_06375 [Gammaproteobacteria bacterium]|nr:MAG: hypothetical protein D6B28_06375 [Gammaproteobacteria bacterium]